jgi:hypothetical protein
MTDLDEPLLQAERAWYKAASKNARCDDAVTATSIHNRDVISGVKESWLHGLHVTNIDVGVTAYMKTVVFTKQAGCVAWEWATMRGGVDRHVIERTDGSFEMKMVDWEVVRRMLIDSAKVKA